MSPWARWRFILANRRSRQIGSRDRLSLQDHPGAVYAIGDVHGALQLLQTLEEEIAADARGAPDRPLVILLGDLIDRGPYSAQVLDHVIAPHPAFDRLCLVGNHERMALAYLEGEIELRVWEALGGGATLRSLGIDPFSLRKSEPNRHKRRLIVRDGFGETRISFLRAMPVTASLGRVVLVHGGLCFDRPLEGQSDEELTSLRPPFPGNFEDGLASWVVHGHTPADEPQIEPGRIGIDTNAWTSGRLTALKIEGGSSRFLSTAGPGSVLGTEQPMIETFYTLTTPLDD